MKLSKEEIIAIHDYYIEKYGGLYGIRDDNLLESQVESPYQTFAGEDLFSSDFDKAVRYMFGFATNQIFIDGNKRTAVGVMLVYLEGNGHHVIVDEKDLLDFALKISRNEMGETEAVDFVKRNCK